MEIVKINGLNIELGKTIEKNVLQQSRIKKPTFISRIIIQKEPGQKIWWAKNCNIYCFDDQFYLLPILDTKIASASSLSGTSAYLFFKKDLLIKVAFQSIGNQRASNYLSAKFSEAATKIFGNPKQEGIKKLWDLGQSYIMVENDMNSSNAHFHWILK